MDVLISTVAFPLIGQRGIRSQYHLRERVVPSANPRVECLTHPLTQVVLTPFLLKGRLI